MYDLPGSRRTIAGIIELNEIERMGALDGKVVVLTRVGAGLGRQFAIRLAREGARLALCDLHEDKAAETAVLAEAEGAEVLAVRCDVSKPDEFASYIDRTIERFCTVDVLGGVDRLRVNNISPSALTDTIQEKLSPEFTQWAIAELSKNAAGRPGDPLTDIAPLVVFLASDESRWISGQNINVDGGELIRI